MKTPAVHTSTIIFLDYFSVGKNLMLINEGVMSKWSDQKQLFCMCHEPLFDFKYLNSQGKNNKSYILPVPFSIIPYMDFPVLVQKCFIKYRHFISSQGLFICSWRFVLWKGGCNEFFSLLLNREDTIFVTFFIGKRLVMVMAPFYAHWAVCKVSNKTIGTLCNIFPLLNRDSQTSKLTLYKLLIQSHLTPPIWNTTCNSNYRKLQVIQNKSLHIIRDYPRGTPFILNVPCTLFILLIVISNK